MYFVDRFKISQLQLRQQSHSVVDPNQNYDIDADFLVGYHHFVGNWDFQGPGLAIVGLEAYSGYCSLRIALKAHGCVVQCSLSAKQRFDSDLYLLV